MQLVDCNRVYNGGGHFKDATTKMRTGTANTTACVNTELSLLRH